MTATEPEVQMFVWALNSIDGGPPAGRSIEQYEKMLAFHRKELCGKYVLDLGAGPEARFAEELRWYIKRNTKVFSLSPDYTQERKWDFIRTYNKRRKVEEILENPLAGLAEQLPFKSDCFDEILALYSVSRWSHENFRRWVPEICRVLKKGGTARIGPYKLGINQKEIFSVIALRDSLNILQDRFEFEKRVRECGASFRYVESSVIDSVVLNIRKT